MAQPSPAAASATRPQSETVSVEVAAARLGLSRSKAYELARQEGALLAGVPVLRFGRKLAIPIRALDRVLGADDPAASTPDALIA